MYCTGFLSSDDGPAYELSVKYSTVYRVHSQCMLAEERSCVHMFALLCDNAKTHSSPNTGATNLSKFIFMYTRASLPQVTLHI